MKTDIRPIPLIHPSTITIIGTVINEKPNFTTIGDVAVAGINPPLVMISFNESHNAMAYINKMKSFSINIPRRELLGKVDFAGMHSSKEVDKSTLFQCDIIDGVPIMQNAQICMIVKENKRIQIQHRVILVCDVIRTFVEKDLIQNNGLSLELVDSILYGLDNRYYGIGKPIGIGYQEGSKNI